MFEAWTCFDGEDLFANDGLKMWRRELALELLDTLASFK